MGFLDRLLGRDETPDRPARNASAPARSDDEIAVERYRYLLRTAPPETIEQVHAEAFEKLTPEQRQMVFDDLSSNAPHGEAPRDSSPAGLASAATRSELRQPGTLERSFGGGAGGGGRAPGFGSMVGGSLLGTVAGYVIGSAIVSSFLPPMDGSGEAGSEGDTGSEGDAGSGDAGSDAGGDAGGWDASGGDFGGGDFGGGDFGF
jgi:hypothetical protein